MAMLHSMLSIVPPEAAAQLRSTTQGLVILPGDLTYDGARRAWNLSVDQYPAMIVVVENTQDVVESVCFANVHNLPVTVQSTGHGVIRQADNALLLVTSKMNAVRVNVEAQTAWIQAGAKWGEVLPETQAVGLAPLLGSSSTVGVVGYTLGGGMGWLARKYGLAADSVRYFTLVDASGQIRRVSSSENQDLFEALRGGGGGFGIITEMEINLYPVMTVYGGNLHYAIEDASEVLRHYREWIATVPDELTSSISIMNYPPLEILPEFLRGQSFVIVRGCYCGPVAEGESLIQSWREWKQPLIDAFRVMPFTEAASISQDPVDPLPGMSSGAWMTGLDDQVIDTFIQFGVTHNGLIKTEIRHAGGAMKQDNPGVYSHRETDLLLQLVAITPTPEAHHQAVAYIRTFKEALQPALTGGVYMNFLEGEESQARTRDGFSSANFERLQALKRQLDPEQRFQSGFDFGLSVDMNN